MDFTHVGSHCEAEHCNQQDFLPFKCSCAKTFCLQHRSPVSHQCSAIGSNDMTSLDCPVCHKSVLLTRIDDPNIVWEKHYATVCTRVEKQKLPHTPCAAVGCNIKLNPSTTMTCKTCGNKTCIAHRLPSHHHCVRSNKSRLLSEYECSVAAPLTNIVMPSVAEKLVETYDEKMTANSSTKLTVAIQEDEVCPQCSRRFTDVMALIAHVELDHSRMTGKVR